MTSPALPTRVRPVALAAILGIALVACSDDSESADEGGSTTPITVDDTTSAGPAVTYEVESGDTLSGIAASHGLMLDELIDINGWSDGADHAIFPGDVVELPAGAEAVPTTRPRAAATTRPSSSGRPTSATTSTTGEPRTEGGYRDTGLAYAGPATGEATDPIADPLPDGLYWAERPQVIGGGTAIEFMLVQHFSGDACLEEFGTAPLTCESGGATGDEFTTATMFVIGNTASVIDLDRNSGTPVAYRVLGEELVRLIDGQAPADDAPEGFEYVEYPFIVAVSNGEVVAADQQFQS